MMPEWAAEAPWWVVAGLTLTVGVLIVKVARWTARAIPR